MFAKYLFWSGWKILCLYVCQKIVCRFKYYKDHIFRSIALSREYKNISCRSKKDLEIVKNNQCEIQMS